jgi:PAS domain S-box-containing protein
MKRPGKAAFETGGADVLMPKRSDSPYELLINAITDYAIYMLDPEGNVTTWNPGAQRFKGYDANEIIGEHFSRFFTPEDRTAELPARALRIAAREGRFEAEGWRVRKDGTRFWANAVLDPIRDSAGKLLGFAKITRDITDKKEAERALRESEQRFQILVRSVTDYAIYMLDPQGIVVTWNAGARRFKGYEADEIIGDHFSRFFSPEDRKDGVPARILRKAAEEGRFEAQGWRVRKDGTRFLAHVVVDRISDDDGRLLGFAKITRDVTDSKERERELFRSQQRFETLVQGVRDYAIYMLDTEGHVTNWNTGAREIKGYEEAEIVGQHFSRFYTEEARDRGEPTAVLQEALRNGRYETEAERVRKDGSLFWAHVIIDPIFDEDGEHVGFAKITRDVTDRKKAEAQLAEAQAALLQSQKLQAIGELTGGIAHDFNNLMTVVSGSVELLQRRPDLSEEKRQRYLRQIADTADRATKLVGQLLAFGRRQALQPEVLDLNVRLDAFSEMMSRTLGSLYTVRLVAAPALGRVEVDPSGLETSLMNAVLNARDAMASGGAITITTENRTGADGEHVVVSVADNGEGMSRELLGRVFEPFFTTKPVGKGTGLGLAQIHGFAEQSGGRVEIESEVGTGTTVRLVLPRTDKPLTEVGKAAGEARVPAGLRVLLTEDSPHVRQFAKQLLLDLKCEVIEASDGNEALLALAASSVDVLFSDIVMPGMTGVELARVVQQNWPKLPILLTTGYSEEVIKGKADDLTVLRKPYGVESLAAAIASVAKDLGPASHRWQEPFGTA